MRDESLHVLQHALGLDQYGRGEGGRHPFNTYRNRYVASEGGRTWDLLMAHVEAGRMARRGPSDLYGGDDSCCFFVTDAGRDYVRDHSATPPKVSRAKERYLRWLSFSAAYPDVKFGDWLREESKRGRELCAEGREH